MNMILNTDSYKFSHYLFYPEGTRNVFSYAEARGGKYDANVFFGLTAYIQKYLTKPVNQADVNEAAEFAVKHGVPFNREGWDYIVEKHQGYLPVEIRAVKEGSLIPVKNVLCTVVNTDDNCAWLTSYLETSLLRIWYTTTVATRIFNMKRKIKPYFDRTSDGGNMDFAILDFSARGCSSFESNELGGAAYLMLFLGSDSVSAVDFVNKLYEVEMSGFSVPATEHSIMCAYGHENEFESFRRILEQAPEGGIISVVSDTWDIFNASVYWVMCKDIILRRNLTLVVRPDSGEIWDVLPKVLTTLREGFGATKNEKGFDVLNNVKVLWGDGINEESCDEAFKIAEVLGISSDSIITGSGGGLMQANIDRDTSKFAFKASAIKNAEGKWFGIAKDPITDKGKQSKKGLLDLVKVEGGDYITIDTLDPKWQLGEEHSKLVTYYKNGTILHKDSLEDIRKRINEAL
jgi:nicotinamide phosphoribosyltransferase